LKYTGLKIGWGITGSYCSITPFLEVAWQVKNAGADIFAFASPELFQTNTRFGLGEIWQEKLHKISTGNLSTNIVEAECFGPKIPLDIMVIAPLTGTSMAKIALGISDTPVLMAAKATMRNGKPLLLAVSTNDALGINAENLGKLLSFKGIYFVPFRQDDPYKKPRSLIALAEKLPQALDAAIKGQQVQPIFVTD